MFFSDLGCTGFSTSLHTPFWRSTETVEWLGGFKGKEALPRQKTCPGICEPQCCLLSWTSSWPDCSSWVPLSQVVELLVGTDGVWVSPGRGPWHCTVAWGSAGWGSSNYFIFTTEGGTFSTTNYPFHGNHPYYVSCSQNPPLQYHSSTSITVSCTWRSRAAVRPTEKQILIFRGKFNYSQREPFQKC